MRLTETRIFYSNTRNGRGAITSMVPVVVGMEADREFALYLIELVRNAAVRGWKDAMREHGYSGRDAASRRSFKIGVGVRIGERMNELAQERQSERAKSRIGTGLVVLKDQLIEQEMSDTRLVVRRRRSTSVDGDAYAAGRSAGNRVGLGRPVGGSSSTASLR